MGDSEVLYDVQRTLGFVKRNIDALSRKVGDRPQKFPAEKLCQTVVRAAAAALVTSQNGMDASAAHKRFMIEHGHAGAFKTGGGSSRRFTIMFSQWFRQCGIGTLRRRKQRRRQRSDGRPSNRKIDAMPRRQKRRRGRGHVMGYLVRAVTDEQTES